MKLPEFIEVEIGSYCNRRCPWCPNGWHDRGQRRESMVDATWAALLKDLAQHDYSGWFAFHNYNEPMADPRLNERISEARAHLPNARLELHTNGDFLDKASLAALQAVGMDLVRVTLYPSDDQAFEEPKPERLDRFLARLGCAGRGRRTDKTSKLEHQVRVGKLILIVRLPRVAHYTDRAGSVGLRPIVSTAERTQPCHLPSRSAAIDYLGNLKLCCHIYDAAAPENARYVMGNVGKTAFSQLWAAGPLCEARKQLARADFSQLPACARCSHLSHLNDE